MVSGTEECPVLAYVGVDLLVGEDRQSVVAEYSYNV